MHLPLVRLPSKAVMLKRLCAHRKAASSRPQQVSLVERQRAHNICIELSGIHMAMADIKTALTTMDMSAVSTDALMVLQRAVPTAQEVKEIREYLAGKHPKYRDISDVNRLGACERCASPVTGCFASAATDFGVAI
jgi:hypothetical protein